MNRKIRYFLILFILIIQNNLSQVNLSVYSEISIVTAGPGEELYEKFGHSAIRVKDPVLNLDLIYNYGVFDFEAPNFLLNFAQGKMYYLLARYDFKYFLASYQKDKRWLKQQVLNLNQNEKQQFFNYLENNALPENATYLYDPFFDNCATKLRDITKEVLGNTYAFNTEKIQKNKTLRSLMNQEIHWNTWGNFGINLIAGTILDKERSQLEYMYLPDYVYQVFKHSTIQRDDTFVDLVKKEEVLLNFDEIPQDATLFSPLNVFIILLLIVAFVTYRDVKFKKRSKYLDFTIFFTTGFVGCILAYLWLFSSHTTAPNNFNILWAFAPNLIVAFLLLKKKIRMWLRAYILTLLILLLAVPFLWILEMQLFSMAFIPLFLILFVRYLFLYKYLLASKK
ncbi:DUF4105 domain-containing protein [uncultured Polaribacter sp.]|uniref:lipoprotein N-acyltransferase Lnb domain-containing protein n=1 Tax=uncultured Polaribacter sp. TaxID=174711 RepID=UPI00262399FB|nr:DUF4105 domain-containing protein [uncultured Polaribacter sp.]